MRLKAAYIRPPHTAHMTGKPVSSADGFSAWAAISMTRAAREVAALELKRAGARKERVMGRRTGRTKRGAIVSVVCVVGERKVVSSGEVAICVGSV